MSIHNIRPGGVDSPKPPGGSEPPMELTERINALEKDVTAIKIDVAVIKANGAAKSDIADVRTAIAEAKTSIIVWSVGAIFLTQLLPSILKLFIK